MEKNKNIYLVEIQEVLRRTVAVSAESHVDALDKVRTAYDDEQIILSGDDCVPEDTVLTASNEAVALVDIPPRVHMLEVENG